MSCSIKSDEIDCPECRTVGYKPTWAVRRSTPLADLCGLVSQQRVLGCVLAVAASLELCQITVVITLHLQVKHLGLARGGSGDKVIVQQLQDAGADVAQLLLYLQQSGHSADQNILLTSMTLLHGLNRLMFLSSITTKALMLDQTWAQN